MFVRRFLAVAAVLALAVVSSPAAAQETSPANPAKWDPMEVLRTERYLRPPADLERMLLAPRTDISFTMASPDRSWFLRAVSTPRGDILTRGKEHVLLGGLQVDTKANRVRSFTTSNQVGLVLVNPRTGATRAIETPKGATITAHTWSPNGAQIAYIANFDVASYAFVADAATGKSAQVSKAHLLPTMYTDLEYTADSKNLIVVLMPDGRGPAPTHGPNGIEDGPTVRMTDSRAVPQPVHASLLLDLHDKALLKYYTMGQLALIDVKSKAVRKIGTPKMIRDVSASLDGQFFSVTQMTEPFSYLVPVSSFGSVRELWDINGKTVTTLQTTRLREGSDDAGDNAPAGFGRGQQTASDTGKRNIEWNPVGPGLTYVESVFAPANDNAPTNSARGGRGLGGAGGPGAGAPGLRGGPGANQRPQPTSVRFMSWMPPFGPNDTKLIYEGGPQLGATTFSADGKMLFASDSGTVFAVRLADGKRSNLGRGVTLARAGGGGFGGGGGGGGGGRGFNLDSANMSGAIQTRSLPGGRTVVVVSADGKSVATNGNRSAGANWSTQSPRPWVDKVDIETAQHTRVFESPADMYESFVAPLDDNYSQYLYTRESATTIPDVWMRDVAASTTKKITNNVDVGPQVSGAQLKRFQVTRPRDGHSLWVDVTLPKDWRPGQRLPGIIWFYPREFTQQADYERTRYTTNINRFPEVPSSRPASSVKLWVSQGYALIEPDVPIWGDSGKMNDNYTRDLRENLDAVVDAVVDAGFVDRDRLGIGGHSYGAFSTVNALTLVPYFKAGIAGDGMYNRSLTPFGFQSERRNFFQAQDTYLDMSPFFRADKISGALLMYHSWEDQNTGTSPISSLRMMAALQGLGKPAALYMYPYEDHSFAALQSDMDLWARWVAWMDIYVKNPRVEKKPVP
jgi:dipeptidyl aminopeptidase/acylaminoacyl peptidase